jgi:hypothetical protein
MLNADGKFMGFRMIIIFLAISMTGCSGIVVSQDYASTRRFSGMKTYAWKSHIQEKTGDIRVDSPFIDTRFRNAIDNAMKQKGLQKIEKSPDSKVSPDFLITYQYSLRPKITSSSSGDRKSVV